MGRWIFTGIFENARVLVLEFFDLLPRLGEDLFPGGSAGNYFVLNSDAGRGLFQFSPDPRLQVEQVVQPPVRKETSHIYVPMRAANAVDASMALHQAHRIPGQIVVDNVARLLKVHTFSKDIGRYQNVVAVLVGSGRRLARLWSETEDRLFARDAVSRLVTDHRDHAPSIRREPTISFERLL